MLKNDSTRNKIRKKKKIITSNQIREIEIILENESLDRKDLIQEQLQMEARIKVSKLIIKNIIGNLDYHKYLSCQKGWQLLCNYTTNCVKYA